MKAESGKAIFTGKCGNYFHFRCIGNNIKHENNLCPICRCKWKGSLSIWGTRMKVRNGEAILTAECRYFFHFKCICNNTKHVNHFCPIYTCKWKELPFSI
ncbi:hypothetical protein MTR67_007612 [Solanum verrucosum]|uniref:RING-type domain-containing protein n=1 Tax=Solanum verrucosum TaxID=315347 RepID=A0AAF0TAW9_SOLVR|nr:hypothetical protein MTR67_007612 [Solanum verrucosum]